MAYLNKSSLNNEMKNKTRTLPLN